MADSAVARAPQVDTDVWKVLVVDGESAVHQVTRLALHDLSVLGRPGQLINALSASDAREQLEKHPDIAVVLLDVVMETESAGLELIRHIRQQANNPLVRIILRTSQAGQAPARQMMLDYDISDYREKTELTAGKLFTTVVSGIRNFGQLQTMALFQRGAETLGRVNGELYGAASKQALAEVLVAQLEALQLFSAVACWLEPGAGAPAAASLTAPRTAKLPALLRLAQAEQGTVVQQGAVYALALAGGHAVTLCLQAPRKLEPHRRHLLDLWAHSVGVALAHWTATA